ncbi:phosphoribosylamine--glycine ligase [Candidatus Saccharibacteria bacterium]|nr:MAG: phosphoribosylamine--glycine ligase [Candidatus Saccharibacteria bacterium]
MAKILIIGSGGREHALAWGIAQSPKAEKVYVSPGNAGTAQEQKCENVALSDKAATLAFCKEQAIDLVVIGPEAPLVAGQSDHLRANGITVFGASKAAAQLEASKAFATHFMQKHGITIPESVIVTSAEAAQAAITIFGGPEKSVIKANGLAGGKGVFLPENEAEAGYAIEKITSGAMDGDGSRFVVQARNHGPEVSVFVLSDGQNYQIIPLASQDHKRLLAGDKGPNTGGMGVYAPLPSWMLSAKQWEKIDEIAQKSITGMATEHTPYQGVLYLGLMLSEELGGDPLVIEYNARFGDPETEVVIPLLQGNDVDIYEMLYATATGNIANFPLPTSLNGAALTICLAAEGYPESPVTGMVIEGLSENYRNVSVFHGGTKLDDAKNTVSSGGRVLYVTSLGVNLQAASEAANSAIGENGIHFKNMQYRSDIAWRALNST